MNRPELWHKLIVHAEDPCVGNLTLNRRECAILRRWVLELSVALTEADIDSGVSVSNRVDAWVRRMDTHGRFDD